MKTKKTTSEQFPIGTIIRHTAKFLQSTGQYTSKRREGVVVGFSEEISSWVRVKWNDGDTCLVHRVNIMVKGKPDYSGM